MAASGYPSATRSGASRYGAPGGRNDGGPARAQYLEPDATVSPQILADGQHPYAMDELEQAITDIDIVGFTLLKNVLSGEECEELLAIHREVADAYGTPSGTAEDGESWHVANLPTLHPAFWRICDHPRVVPIIDHFLGNDCILGSLSSRIVRPGDPAQRLHGDIPEHMLNMQEPVMMNTVWMLSDTGAFNGGTRIVPGSHRSMMATVPAGYTPQFVHTPAASAGSVLICKPSHSDGSLAAASC